jgi:hypothetical protein
MAGQARDGDANFLRRWSQRKLAAARPSATEPPPVTPAPTIAAPSAAAPAGAVAEPATASGSSLPADPTGAAGDEAQPLPPIESLGFDSDFTRFLAPKVDEAVKRQALRKLFNDPRFNVMDGLDVYIDDYSKFEPIPADLVGKLRHARYIFDPPKTRVNEAGHVEDVPDEPPPGAVAATDAQDGAPDAQAAATGTGHADTQAGAAAPGVDVAKPIDALPSPPEDALPSQQADTALPGPAVDGATRERVPAASDNGADTR